MIRILVLLLFLSTSVLSNENNCTYETKTISKNGQVVDTHEVRICKETTELKNKTFFQKFLTEKEYETSLILFTVFLMERVL